MATLTELIGSVFIETLGASDLFILGSIVILLFIVLALISGLNIETSVIILGPLFLVLAIEGVVPDVYRNVVLLVIAAAAAIALIRFYQTR